MNKNETKGTETRDRITGDDLVEFRLKHGLSINEMADLFGSGFTTMQAELNCGPAGIASRGICYLYRIYSRNPNLLERGPDIQAFYKALREGNITSGTNFSIALGLELTAYVRYFREGGDSPSKTVQKIVAHALKVSNNDPVAAFGFIRNMAIEEGLSRGFDPFAERTWRDPKREGAARAPRPRKSARAQEPETAPIQGTPKEPKPRRGTMR